MNDPVDLLIGLVDRASPSGDEHAAVAYLVQQMARAGFEARIDDAGNAVGSFGAGPTQVLLLGHIDTVPGHIPVRQDGDLLYGRGTVDAKGPLAAFVASAALKPRLGLRVTVIGVVGEEVDSPGATYVRDHYPRPDFLVIGEPSRWDRVTLGYKGSAWYEFEVERPVTHTAAAESSACEQAVDVWQTVRAWCADANTGHKGVFNQLTPTLRGMHSDSDGLNERAGLRVGFRLPSHLSPTTLDENIRKVVGDQAHVRARRGAVPAYRAGKNNALVRAALASIRAEGGEPGFVLKSGTSDMNLVAPVWGCAAIAYGPGDSSLDHTPHEHISIAEYLQSIRVLQRILKRLAGDNG